MQKIDTLGRKLLGFYSSNHILLKFAHYGHSYDRVVGKGKETWLRVTLWMRHDVCFKAQSNIGAIGSVPTVTLAKHWYDISVHNHQSWNLLY